MAVDNKNRQKTDSCSNCDVLQDEIDVLKGHLAEMERRAHFDFLTKLPNRRYFIENLEHRILRCERYGDVTALLFLDVDNLKQINDNHGHLAGDECLTRLADILASNIRASDMVARIGGDEFAMLIDNVDADEVDRKIGKLMKRIARETINNDNKTIKLSAAIGYCFVGPKDSVDGLMSRADAAMYEVKNQI